MLKKVIVSIICSTLLLAVSYSQKVLRLYEGKAPGSEDWNYNEIEFSFPGSSGKMIRNVVDPTLTVYMPDKSVATGTAVIICPGGGNVWLSFSSEGTDVAEWLVKKGVTAFVLKYRLKRTPEDPAEFQLFVQNFFKSLASILKPVRDSAGSKPPVPLPSEKYPGGDDGIKALQYVREHSGEFGIDPHKVGIMGFSAGAGLTIHVIINSAPGKQPDFAAPIYGGWLGDSKIPEDAAPLFILAASDDLISAGCPDLYKAWRTSGHSAELHIYSKGGHGFGMARRGLPVDSWIERFYDWMKTAGF